MITTFNVPSVLISLSIFFASGLEPSVFPPDPGHDAVQAVEPADDKVGKLLPYQLPVDSARSLERIASQSDVLVLGEAHGSQEVPAVVTAMLMPLDKLGYGVLAIEVPSDQQEQLIAWATGKTTDVPSFYAKPGTDGRGNIQMLSLIRAAVSEPLRWKLICFDGTEAEMLQDEDLEKEFGPDEIDPAQIPMDNRISDVQIRLNLKRDARMASNLARESKPLDPHGKVLAICGNLHARTANNPAPDNPIGSLWPSFAAELQRTHATWHVRSVDINFHGGECFFNGKVSALAGSPLGEAETRTTPGGDWDLELHLPRATPATFLVPPSDPPPTRPARDK